MAEKVVKETGSEQDSCERLAWDRPTVLTFDVIRATEGGTFDFNSPGDDAWYSS
ncbi:hypothetical protein [Sphingorhabdus sp. 109]|jgi:hypothetical protein|uniref:hypothetical protein n=1 Tax=Sphingorhabdus sp. 109 TaxID=2653173 RepID=UPI00135BA6F3|nr:hypothetical protein [Sphingorhabdus sp. 109]